jgi:hypothetical protein
MIKETKEVQSEFQQTNEEDKEAHRVALQDIQPSNQTDHHEIEASNIDSKIISNKHVELISNWIDKVDTSYASMFSISSNYYIVDLVMDLRLVISIRSVIINCQP